MIELSLSLGQLIVWVIIGALAGTLAGRLVTRSRRGYGVLTNTVIGMVGGLIGGILFDVFNVDMGLLALTFTLTDLIAAFVGSLILIAILRLVRR